MFRVPHLSKTQHIFIRMALTVTFLASILVGGILGHLQQTYTHADTSSQIPVLQLPWPTGAQHGISGYTYHQNDHGVTCCSWDDFAIDFGLRYAPVSAVAAGCAHMGPYISDGYGNFIWISHPGNYVSIYAHLDSFDSSVYPASPNTPCSDQYGTGAFVFQGQVIGISGCSGHCDGAHLHFALHGNAAPFNATPYYDGTAAKPEPMSGYIGFDQSNPPLYVSNPPNISTSSCSNGPCVKLFQGLPPDPYQAQENNFTIASSGFYNLPSWMVNKVSSITIPAGWYIIVYEQANRGGGRKIFYQSIPDLNNGPNSAPYTYDKVNYSLPISGHMGSVEVGATNICIPSSVIRKTRITSSSISATCQQPPPQNCPNSAAFM